MVIAVIGIVVVVFVVVIVVPSHRLLIFLLNLRCPSRFLRIILFLLLFFLSLFILGKNDDNDITTGDERRDNEWRTIPSGR